MLNVSQLFWGNEKPYLDVFSELSFSLIGNHVGSNHFVVAVVVSLSEYVKCMNHVSFAL